MKLNNLWRALLEYWPIKVFSLLLAISVFLVINYATLDTRTVEIPLQVRYPSGYEATSTVVESVQLRIRADERYISMINPGAITAVADFSHVSSEGVSSTVVQLIADTSLFAVEVSISAEPETIRVFFRRNGRSETEADQQLLGGTER